MNANDADAPLIERIKQGDVRAFEMLVVKYQRRIERLIGRMVRDVDPCPTSPRNLHPRLPRDRPQFRGDSAFYTWLYRIAVNTAKKALVDLKRDPIVTESALAGRDDDDETSRVENELSDGETPDAVLASREIAAAVNSAIEGLSDDLRQAITLREIEGLSYEEIAELMNCPIGTVRSRIFRRARGDRGAADRCSTPRGRAVVRVGRGLESKMSIEQSVLQAVPGVCRRWSTARPPTMT